jgi:hypothetical protein
MNVDFNQAKWSENVIIVDADYVDRVAFNLSVNFERMLMRRVPKADLARWIDCVALDGGVFYEGRARRYVGWSGDGAVRMESADGLEWIVAGGGLSLANGVLHLDAIGGGSLDNVNLESTLASKDYADALYGTDLEFANGYLYLKRKDGGVISQVRIS